MADVRANALAILSSLPPEPKRSVSSVPLLKRSSALRGSRTPSRSNSSTISLVPHLHKRQYSVDSHFSHDKHGKSPDMPFSDRGDNNSNRPVRGHRDEDRDFGLPHPPNSRFSSLNFGRPSSRSAQARGHAEEADRRDAK